MPRPVKDCFGTVISSLSKMKECVRCELLAECRAINWTEQDPESPPVISRRPLDADPGRTDPGADDSGAGPPS